MRKLKKISLEKNNIDAEDSFILEQINLLKKIQHKHISKLYECITTPSCYFLIMDYCKEGTLDDKLKWSIKYSESQIKYLAFQLFEAIQYLNRNKLIHTDIKPINILIDEIVKNENDEDLFNIKLLNLDSYGESIEVSNISNVMMPYYIAPEVIDNKEKITSDIWSVGVIIYQMFYGEVPFNGDNLKELYSNIKNAKITQNTSSSSALRDLLNLIFVKDYSKRITVEKCLEHRWFKIGNKTPTDTGILKKNIIEEINTDTNFIKNEEKQSNSSELSKKKEKSSMKEKSSEENFKSSEDKNSDDESKHSKPVEQKAKRKIPPRTLILGGVRSRKNKNKNKISPLIKYSILFIKYYIRIYFQKDKEINKLNNIYLKYKIEKNINIFVNYINCKRIISFDSFYYNQNDSLNKNLSKNIKEQINNKEELFKILIQNKKNMIEMNLKTSYGKLKKSSVDEIKNIFKESNSFNLYEIKKYKQYFNEIEFEMEKNKYKEIYLFMDFYKLLINSINKLYAQYLNNNISTNVDSNNTFNTMFGLVNKSKESIKNECSKVNSDNIISDQSNNNILSIDIIKEEQEKNKDTINDNNNKNCEEGREGNILQNHNVNNKDSDKNELKDKNMNEISKLNKNEMSGNVNNDKNKNINKLDKSINKSDNNDINNYNCNNVYEDNYNNSDEDEYEKRKNDVNRFDPEKFLINIGFS
jgi:serine/threonine protein kinase